MRTVGSTPHALALVCAVALLPACSILVGNVKPVTEHSTRYQTMEPSQWPDWQRLGPPKEAKKEESDELADPDVTDLAWQSKTSGAVISLNSACRAKFRDESQSLEDFTEQLVLGTTEISDKTSEAVTVSGRKGLQTTLTGVISGRTNRLRVVVVRDMDCIYDLMYVARPKHFNDSLDEFTQFVQAFRINP